MDKREGCVHGDDSERRGWGHGVMCAASSGGRETIEAAAYSSLVGNSLSTCSSSFQGIHLLRTSGRLLS